MTSVTGGLPESANQPRPLRARANSAVEAMLYQFGRLAAATMPVTWSHRALTMVAETMYRMNPPRVRFLRENAKVIVDGLDGWSSEALVHAAVLSRAGAWLEFLRFPSMTDAHIIDQTRVTGLDHLKAALEEGEGAAVLALLHSRNMDFAIMSMIRTTGSLWMPLGSRGSSHVRRSLQSERARRGIHHLPPSGERGKRFEFLLRALAGGKCVVVVTDVVNDGVGVPVDLLGHRAVMSSGAAALAMASGKPLIPVSSWSEDGYIRVAISSDVLHDRSGMSVGSASQRVADCFAATIRRAPQDWHGLWEHIWDDSQRLEDAAAAGGGPV